MYVLVRCKVDFIQPTPEPVLLNAPPPFPYAMARSQLGNIEFMCEVPEGFNATNYFVHPIATSGITPEMYQAMMTRYVGWGLNPSHQWLESPLLNQDIVFFVASEDCRPIAVESSTPQYEKLFFPYFEGVSLIKAKSTIMDAVMHYWPDSFCHQKP